ncbi:MAG: GMC family oxidoreductase [Chthoniobacterales bacterium]
MSKAKDEQVFLVLNPDEASALEALFERMFPADADCPGASEIGVVRYLDRALAGAYAPLSETYRLAIEEIRRIFRERYGCEIPDGTAKQREALISDLAAGAIDSMKAPDAKAFFNLLRSHLQEGLFSDPIYGGNLDKLGWRVLGHPGVWLENTAEENLTDLPVTKGGIIQSLADLGRSRELRKKTRVPGYDSQGGTAEPVTEADVVLVGLGGVGGIVAPVLAKAGLRVVAFEAGPWRTSKDYLPDELGATYYCRANMGPKFQSEAPTWRRNDGEPTREATFSLGRMMNSVGGSLIHYGAWLRRFHPHHFHSRSHLKDRWGLGVLPEGCALADWPVSYDELEPYYSLLEHEIGVAGDETNPFIKRSRPLPMPPMRPFRLGDFFRRATESMGLHPHPVPAGVNTVPYRGRPATTYTAWSNGFGSFCGDKWDPSLTSIPEALATGNLDLRTHCRAIRIGTDESGHANGIEYIDPLGSRRFQKARIVILSAYTFENIRLLLLSGDKRHPNGLGNNCGRVGHYFMTKMFAHVDGFFPDLCFNRHTGPAAQGIVVDDFLSPNFDSLAYGFIGGATMGAEQQFLPIQISREALPRDVRSWGKPYKDHIRNWQNFGVVRIQPDTLSYRSNFLDLDPSRRDKSGLGLPVIRITYDMRENEHRLADWMEGKGEEILQAMGATKVWRGDRFTGVGSSHDFGGARMGEDAAATVTSPELRVHDTPGLYVFSGAVFPTCPGINPTLTLLALCWRAADRLVDRLRKGEEP